MSCGGALDPCGLVQGYRFPATPTDLSFSGYNFSGANGGRGIVQAVHGSNVSHSNAHHEATFDAHRDDSLQHDDVGPHIQGVEDLPSVNDVDEPRELTNI